MENKKGNGSGNANGSARNDWRVKVGLAEMLKGGVIMDVTNAEQAKIAEKAGACAVMALERVPSDIRTKGEAGSGNVVEAVRHMCTIVSQMKKLTTMRDDELMREAKELGAPLDLIREIAKTGKLPVPNFSAGGIATPADAALVRKLGAEAVFVGSGIFKSSDPEVRAEAIVKAATHFEDPKAVLEAHEELGEAMRGLDLRQLEEKDMLATRGW